MFGSFFREEVVSDDMIGTTISNTDTSTSMSIVVINYLSIDNLLLHPNPSNTIRSDARCVTYRLLFMELRNRNVNLLMFLSRDPLKL